MTLFDYQNTDLRSMLSIKPWNEHLLGKPMQFQIFEKFNNRSQKVSLVLNRSQWRFRLKSIDVRKRPQIGKPIDFESMEGASGSVMEFKKGEERLPLDYNLSAGQHRLDTPTLSQ